MSNRREQIINLLLNKAVLKQDIASESETLFKQLRDLVEDELKVLKLKIEDSRVRLRLEDKGASEFHLYIGSDLLIFQLHTNVFRLDEDSEVWKQNENYLKEHAFNPYFGVINIYNFLAESFERNRLSDEGYLIGRLFVNHERNFLIEAKGGLANLTECKGEACLNENILRQIIQQAVLDAVEFDLLMPPYDLLERASVVQIQTVSTDLSLGTGKRLGYRFSYEQNDFH